MKRSNTLPAKTFPVLAFFYIKERGVLEKIQLRKKILQNLSGMTADEYQLKSAKIRGSLMKDPAFIDARTIGLTISAPPEVDTIELIETCWSLGKNVAVPKCTPESRRMDFYVLENFNQLETVYMKLREPKTEETRFAAPGEIDLMIVPGVVYSRDGYRIGFGGGYFDRYLTRYTGATRSLAFKGQICESVPIEAHDIPVEGIHTEEAYLDIKQVRA